MVQSDGLLNRDRPKSGPWVRIPHPPPSWNFASKRYLPRGGKVAAQLRFERAFLRKGKGFINQNMVRADLLSDSLAVWTSQSEAKTPKL